MSGARPGRAPHAIKAEAAAWLARLRSEDRCHGDEAGFHAWLSEDPLHTEAFELVTAAWDTAGEPGASVAPQRRPHQLQRISRRTLALGGAAALASSAGIGWWRLVATDTFATQIGEQRRIALDDGSNVSLDTNTRIRVAFTDERRQVELVEGRAHFEVATDPLRPFLVRAGNRQVIALGTAFDVTRQADRVAVVLVEGRVAVQRLVSSPQPSTRLMSAGDRVVFEDALEVSHDQPDLAQVTAWQSGRAVFDDQPLAEAVAEMNRYTRRPVVIADEALAQMHLSGVYSTGDLEAFAQSVAVLLAARVELTPTQIVLRAAEEN